MIDAAVKHARIMVDVGLAVQKAVEPTIDKARITHYCSVQPESRLNEIKGLWTDNMVLNLTRGALFDALTREGNRRFASGQRAGTGTRGTSELDILREYARAELAERAKPRR